MLLKSIPFKETNYFSDLICDYLDNVVKLQPFFNRYPSLENFKEQIAEKQASFPQQHRETLHKVLTAQCASFSISEATENNIKLLLRENTFTVTTGHQLNLFTGPLYFLYKIISVINLAEQLQEEYPEYHFVPVYWMATEDHDFEEINYFNFKGKKVRWNREAGGPVGRFDTKGLDEVLAILKNEFGTSNNATRLLNLFEKAYLEQDTLANATLFLANELFSKYGLVIVDGDYKELKRLFISQVKNELAKQNSYIQTVYQSQKLEDLGYKKQVNPREINLFYIKNGLRERIIKEEDRFYVNETEISWTQEELYNELETAPEKFSPNVIMRPLYQEVILPNLCYIGGGGELAYWFELKSYFESEKIPFPILLLRNSVLILSEKQKQKLAKLEVSTKDLFLKQHELINRMVRKISNIDIDFNPQKQHLQHQFKELYELAEQTDTSFVNAVKAQEIKQLKGLDKLEERLLKAQKRKLKDQVTRLTTLQNELFPNQNLQERIVNFSELYLEYGEDLVKTLKNNLAPLTLEFTILKM
ncbi:bacillithiol biosynthesis cysteine-adding enzyme BshC [Aquimarina sp. ERC-38]|uniref:bacillithiol biosynthesis cysteine-adding enzyme BshC n=1 Tax=Aquimarina sp. ERC-38 TaxID=2949996 RepID=UPI002247C74E|nr:bacillithiol biosynthesis cysteine-adding enzyme BshC [Aquimarina sp. ERC-38]UZO79330.1 bacillithiol biosynthesis cysteine-adding enzyme BshC [Aquimarina sp. ERC-38]